MSYSLNLLIIFGILSFVVFFILLKLVQAKKENSELKPKKGIRKEDFSVPALVEYTSNRMIELTSIDVYLNANTEEELEREKRRKKDIKRALDKCNTGDILSKTYVKNIMRDDFKNVKKINEDNICYIIPFDTPSKMTARQKFETVLYVVFKEKKYKALGWIIDNFKLDEPKEDGGLRITESDIENVYKSIMKNRRLSFDDQLRIVTQYIYSHYKGFGAIDEIRDMSIDGVSGGVSGRPKRFENFMESEERFITAFENGQDDTNDSMKSIWIMYHGKTIHLSFLSFEHELELRRVVTNVYKHGAPGQLSESRPYIINEMADNSRTVVMRPKLAESWLFFIRKKYDGKKLDLEVLYPQPDNQIPNTLLKFIMRGMKHLAITGDQGVGKTTLLITLVQFIRKIYTLRVIETKSELNLRNIYDLNIVSLQETDTITGQEAIDLSKKTDGDITILGEVATAPVAAWMVQISRAASKVTYFTGHYKTLTDMVFGLRDALLSIGLYRDERIAEHAVISVLDFNVHLRQIKATGEIFIERITECIPLDFDEEYEPFINSALADDRDAKMDQLIKMSTKFFAQQTRPKQFVGRNLVEYKDGKYVAVHRMSEKRMKEIEYELSFEEREEFREFIRTYWGD